MWSRPERTLLRQFTWIVSAAAASIITPTRFIAKWYHVVIPSKIRLSFIPINGRVFEGS